MSIFKRYLAKRYHLVAGILALFFFCFPADKAYAAGFTHIHTGDCYENRDELCSNHYVKDEYTYEDYHCFTCGTIRTFLQIVFWDICENSGKDGYPVYNPVDIAYLQTCLVCGDHRRCNENSDPRSHRVTRQVLVCGHTENDVTANVSLSLDNSDWTNGPVTISASVSSSDPAFGLSGAPYNFGSGATGDPNLSVDSNGAYSVSVTDKYGRTVSESITVSNIDKTSPVVSLSTDRDDWSESGIRVLVNASDEGSGLSEAAYSYNGGAFTGEASFLATSNGDMTVTVRDRAGNETTERISVTKVGRDPAVIAAEREAEARREAERIEAERKEAERIEAERREAERRAAAAKNNKSNQKTGNAGKNNTTGNSAGSADPAPNEKEKSAEDSGRGEFPGVYELYDPVTGELVSRAVFEGYDEFGNFIGVKGESFGSEGTDEKDTEDAEKDEHKNGNTPAPVGMTDNNDGSDSGNGTGGSDGNAGNGSGDGSNDDSTEGSDNPGKNSKGTSGLKTILAGMTSDNTPLYAGLLILVAGLVFISCFNYVYISNGGRIRPVRMVRVVKDKTRLIVHLSKRNLKQDTRFLLYLSPWLKATSKGLPVYVCIDNNTSSLIPAEAGRTFSF